MKKPWPNTQLELFEKEYEKMSYDFSNLKRSNHPSGEIIVFEDKRHVYYVESDDSIDFSARYAMKHGLEQEDVKKMWKENGRRAAEEGTAVHQYMEDLFFGKDPMVSLYNDRVADLQRKGFEFFYNNLIKNYELVDAEKVIASIDLRIAGMVDLIGINKSTGALALLDYKTNKSLKFENPWQTGLGPLLHLQDTNYNHYCLQLSLYQFIMEREGYLDAYNATEAEPERVVIHINESEVRCYNTPCMKKEIEKMCDFDYKC